MDGHLSSVENHWTHLHEGILERRTLGEATLVAIDLGQGVKLVYGNMVGNNANSVLYFLCKETTTSGRSVRQH
jgi:hypothetical protein